MRKHMKNAEQGAATTVWAAVSKECEGKGGCYLENCSEAQAVDPDDDDSMKPGYAAYAYDEDVAKKLWEVSCQLVGL